MGDCQMVSIILAEIRQFLLVALFKVPLPEASVCYCAMWKIVSAPLQPPCAGLWEVSARRWGPVHLLSGKQLER